MKTFILSIIMTLSILLCVSENSTSQSECGTQDFQQGQAPNDNNFIGGYLKPQRTDISNGSISGSDATFNMLFVFVQFPDETTDTYEWPINNPPIFMNRILDTAKNGNGDFWNRYRDSSLSDYYQEISRGAFHVTGITRHFIMNREWNYYKDSVGHAGFLTEIYERLKADTSIRWPNFDNWSRNDTNNLYSNTKDGYLDMMGIFVRHLFSNDFIGSGPELGAAGFVPLHGPNDYLMYAGAGGNVRMGADRNKYGSGFFVKGNLGPLGYNRSLCIAIHEYGHYLFGNNHSTSGIMTSNGGLSINDMFMSGYEKYKLGLLDTLTADYSTTNSFSMRDISGRNGSSQTPDFPQILKVPITSTDFFIIESRRKISDWDVYMLGDTSRNDPFHLTGDYGKGLYIFHSNSIGILYAGNVDIECADGLWSWGDFGYENPDWTNADTVPVKLRTSLPSIVNNDAASVFFNNYSNADGISAGPWFSIGKKHVSVGQTGTDRIYTNLSEYWTSRERFGDRWDAWNVGYNEIFSPYSNPNTKDVNNDTTGIYIYYHNLANGIAQLKVYRAGFNGYNDSSILAITPPSRPMGLTLDYYVETENITHPMITWNHNKEPDMLRADTRKKYRIWRATYTNMNYVPVGYLLIDSVLIDSGTVPTYIDTTIYGMGTYWAGFGDQVQYPVRYEVEAVDKYEDRSVMSDFASGICVRGTVNADPIGPDSPEKESNVPENFALYQNSPNPFNPVTNIEYDLPVDGNIELKIYDIAGRLMNTLVNEFKTAGSYLVSFNASDLSSGVYFYSMNFDGKQIGVRRMTLVK
ncbi:MAG: T9SS type A sorting domain-containing protein [Ignavibacteria bacterium]|nr:T9SS type A sorting domain-containing protein [Ignavibacteria bacterium]